MLIRKYAKRQTLNRLFCFSRCYDIYCERCESKDRRIIELEMRNNELVLPALRQRFFCVPHAFSRGHQFLSILISAVRWHLSWLSRASFPPRSVMSFFSRKVNQMQALEWTNRQISWNWERHMILFHLNLHNIWSAKFHFWKLSQMIV